MPRPVFQTGVRGTGIVHDSRSREERADGQAEEGHQVIKRKTIRWIDSRDGLI